MNNEQLISLNISVAKIEAPPAPTKPVFRPLSGKYQKKMRQAARKMQHDQTQKYR